MGGFDKIEFTEKEKKVLPNNPAQMPEGPIGKEDMVKRKKIGKFKFKFGRKISRKQAIIIAAIVGAFFVLTGIPAYATYSSGLKTYREAKLIATAMKKQDIGLASEKIASTKKHLQETQKNFHWPYRLYAHPIKMKNV